MVNVLFVCLGNICRSPTAEGVFKALVQREGLSDHITVDSAGVGAWSVADLALRLEKDLKGGRPLRAEQIDDLGMAVEEVRDFIARMLANSPED